MRRDPMTAWRLQITEMPDTIRFDMQAFQPLSGQQTSSSGFVRHFGVTAYIDYKLGEGVYAGRIRCQKRKADKGEVNALMEKKIVDGWMLGESKEEKKASRIELEALSEAEVLKDASPKSTYAEWAIVGQFLYIFKSPTAYEAKETKALFADLGVITVPYIPYDGDEPYLAELVKDNEYAQGVNFCRGICYHHQWLYPNGTIKYRSVGAEGQVATTTSKKMARECWADQMTKESEAGLIAAPVEVDLEVDHEGHKFRFDFNGLQAMVKKLKDPGPGKNESESAEGRLKRRALWMDRAYQLVDRLWTEVKKDLAANPEYYYQPNRPEGEDGFMDRQTFYALKDAVERQAQRKAEDRAARLAELEDSPPPMSAAKVPEFDPMTVERARHALKQLGDNPAPLDLAGLIQSIAENYNESLAEDAREFMEAHPDVEPAALIDKFRRDRDRGS